MSLVNKYRWGNVSKIPVSDIEIDSLATLESIRRRQGWMIAAQVATVAAIANQTEKTTDALRLVNDTLISIEATIQDGFNSLESSIDRLEANLIENLNEIKWYLFNVDQKLDQLINLVKFSGATKSAEYNKQGFILYKIGSLNDAINQLNKSLQENPLNIEAYINLGFVYLREEKLEESILNFEKASKLVKEDFSYFEEVSQDRLKTTEVFILDNLATLYALQEKHNQSIDSLNKILSKDIDKKTEILSKYKLSKYLCLSGDNDGALEIINDLINNQYFEPVALAVSNPEFKSITKQILSTLQSKLENVKKSFENDGNLEVEKINFVEIDPNTKSTLIDIVTKVNSAVNDSSNYSILLTSEFKERHNNYLSFIELLSELKSRSSKELNSLHLDYLKLDSIKKYNDEIDTNYSFDDDVSTISHKIFLSKLKSNVKNSIDSKMSQFDLAKTIHYEITLITDKYINEINELPKEKMVEYISSDFNFSVIINNFKFSKNQDSGKKNNNKVETESIGLKLKVIDDYNNLLSKYQAKEKIIKSNLNRSSSSDEVINSNTVLDNYKDKIKLVAKTFKGSYEEAIELLKDSELFIEMIKSLDADIQGEFLDAFNDENYIYDSEYESKENNYQEVIDLAKSGKKLEAVKLLKDLTGWGLKESKDWVDERS